jgi:hypothetical protein
VQWVTNQESPFFICVVDRKRLSIELYATWNIHNSYLWRRPEKISLRFNKGIDVEKPTYPRSESEARGRVTVPLGKPILKINIRDVNNEERFEGYRSVLKHWILLEQENIVNIRQKMHWIEGYVDYETNIMPLPNGRVIWLYFNLGANRDAYTQNLTRMAAVYRLAWNDVLKKNDPEDVDRYLAPPIRLSQIFALETTLTAYWPELESEIPALLEKAGIQLDHTARSYD